MEKLAPGARCRSSRPRRSARSNQPARSRFAGGTSPADRDHPCVPIIGLKNARSVQSRSERRLVVRGRNNENTPDMKAQLYIAGSFPQRELPVLPLSASQQIHQRIEKREHRTCSGRINERECRAYLDGSINADGVLFGRNRGVV
jgi:hypothetical protein